MSVKEGFKDYFERKVREIEEILIQEVADPNHQQISVKNFYDSLNLNVKHSSIYDIIENRQTSVKNQLAFQFLPDETRTLDDYVSFMLPRELLNQTWGLIEISNKELTGRLEYLKENIPTIVKFSGLIKTGDCWVQCIKELLSGLPTIFPDYDQICEDILWGEIQKIKKQRKERSSNSMVKGYITSFYRDTKIQTEIRKRRLEYVREENSLNLN